MMRSALKWLLRVAVAAVALVSVLLLALFFAGHREGAGHNQAAIEIARPPEQVFAHFNDLDKFKKWVTYVKEIRVDGGELHEGAKIHVVSDVTGGLTVMDEEVLAWEPARRVELRIQSPPDERDGFVEHTVYSLDDLGGGHTRVAAVIDSTYRGARSRLLEPYKTLSTQKAIEADLARLKANVEAEPLAAAPAGAPSVGEK